MNQKKICLVLAFDANFFQQAQACIKKIQQHCTYEYDICALVINLEYWQIQWLRQSGVRLTFDYSRLPKYHEGFPLHAYTQLCRPYLREIFSGYDIYMWIDADIRIVHQVAFDAYLGGTLAEPSSIVICQEVDPLYSIVCHPQSAYGYHTMINQRIESVYGAKVCSELQYFYNFNTGIWAMHKDSIVWESFQAALNQALNHPYNHMREQDAMNVAIVNSSVEPVILPSIMNWLCALAKPPKLDPETQRFIRPGPPQVPIAVIHLVCSESELNYNGRLMKWYDFYKLIGLAE